MGFIIEGRDTNHGGGRLRGRLFRDEIIVIVGYIEQNNDVCFVNRLLCYILY